MAAENEIQFFEAPFQYSIWEFSSNVNLSYHKLINTRPIKKPFMNTGFETVFSQAYNEKWDKSYFAIKKREWFRKTDNLEDIVKDWLLLSKDNWRITDHQIVDWNRFVMVVSSDWYRLTVLRQKPWYYSWCKKVPNDIETWEREVVGPRSTGKWYYKTNPCAYHKFQKAKTLQDTSLKWTDYSKLKDEKLYIWNVVYESWATQAVLFNEDKTAIDKIKIWDFIQIYNADDQDVVVWQSLQVWEFDSENGWYNMWYWQWLWITDKNSDKLNWYTLNYQWPVQAYIYDEVKEWIVFAWFYDRADNTKDKNWIWEWNWHEFTFVQQTNLHNANITSITEHQDWIVYTTDKWYINFLRPRWNSMQDLWWTIYNTINLYSNWDLAKSCWNYIFLFWTHSIWIAYKTGTDNRWDITWEMQMLNKDVWYFDKDSVMIYNEELYLVDSYNRFIKMDLEAWTDTLYRPIFKTQIVDMSLHRINTDLRNLDYWRWDRVHLCKDKYRIYLIIEDSWDKDIDHNTKILVYEDEYKYRHWRYLCDMDIRWFNEWEWFWAKWFYRVDWNKDYNWKRKMSFKQIISLTFWDTSYFTWKELIWIKMAIWYHSKISADTIFSLRTDWWWFSSTVKMNTLHETAYVKAITELYQSWKTNSDDMQQLYYNMPIGIWIYSWNWVWLIKDKIRTAKTEFEQYCDYEDPVTYYINNCCDAKPGSEESDNWCAMVAPKANMQNFWSDRLQYHYNVSKYATLQVKTNQQWQNFYLELIANNDDEIEFIWFMIGWMFMDNNFDAIWNMPYYLTTPKDSLPWMMWK